MTQSQIETDKESLAAERGRILAENHRRSCEVRRDRYAPWDPAELLTREERKRVAARMLQAAGVFPQAGDPCLEVGFGSMGWLADLISWGIREPDLYGIELDPGRAKTAQAALPLANLVVGDAGELPWEEGKFRLIVISTVFTSILDDQVRRRVASEIERVLAPGGALLWYDFAVNNPANRHVRGIGRRELRKLFPQLAGPIRSVTLAPPLARLLAPRSWLLASCCQAIPPLRTHLLGILKKAETNSPR